ncbi:uncharacterized protein LOC114581259 [Dendrobium catenatum]|uniref:uncharacterized protein LOC114581259 n=1 Tax=Dendrobium catenatum TaxID=906689 RepID=UPI00109F7FA4|nr:uncharacterized protein LOC114581259 [Dendrobium catenatum]
MVTSWCRAGEIEPQPPASSVSSGSDQAQASPTSAMEPGVSGSGKVQTAALVFLQINASPTAGFAVNMSNGGSEIAKDCRYLNDPMDSTVCSEIDRMHVNTLDEAIHVICNCKLQIRCLCKCLYHNCLLEWPNYLFSTILQASKWC